MDKHIQACEWLRFTDNFTVCIEDASLYEFLEELHKLKVAEFEDLHTLYALVTQSIHYIKSSLCPEPGRLEAGSSLKSLSEASFWYGRS
mmetsp:Transcript_93923/g.176538  ORF Transcript_93923/g.176538 Transcript_93923/m.176538 type:complete len:89 (-) Transcript_93923:132-398(-)